MAEYAGIGMQDYYRNYGAICPFPKGWMSERKPCPICNKGIAGREEGMAAHIKAKHRDHA